MRADTTARQAAPAPGQAHALTPAIELRDVFRVHRTAEGDAAALQGTTLSVARGEHLCVLGPSGAGKSTLLRVIAGLETPSAGVVWVLGRDVARSSTRARAAFRREAIGFLDQSSEHNLSPDLPVAEGIVLSLALRGVGRRSREARSAELLAAVGLAHRARALPRELSGGERQRLALCAALAHRPSLLLADEPTGELDEASARAVRALIAELARAHAATVVVVSHDAATAAQADRAVRLRDGRVGEERRDGTDALVVNRGGWVRLPAGLLAQAGIAGRATVHPGPGELTLRPAATPADMQAVESTPLPAGPQAVDGHAPVRLECRSLTKSYGRGAALRQVLGGLSVSFAVARFTVVTGRSGSGKSTLLRLLAALEQPDAGDVLLDGTTLALGDAEERARVRRSVLGYLAQDARLVPFLSAQENVQLALQMREGHAAQSPDRAVDGLARLGLADRARQRVSRLSAGERQRVALARALATARGLLLVDEPTSRLDEAATVVVADALSGAARRGHTVICATHEPIVIARADHELAL